MKYHISIVDTDVYKLSMGQAICKLYPGVINKYVFINRDNREFPDGFAERLMEVLDSFRSLRLTNDEKDFLKEKCYYLTPFYIDFLSGYTYDPFEVIVLQEGPTLTISIVGYAYRTVLWEVPLMAAISELYFEMTGQIFDAENSRMIAKNKAIEFANIGVYYSEFGTRRRHSFFNQDLVVSELKKYSKGNLLGTSNVYLAMKHNLLPLGTVAHEWFQLHAALHGYVAANEAALEAWVNVYQGSLGIALPDTFTTDVFYKTFGMKYAKLFDGVRQDSDDPLKFLEKSINHYQQLKIDPKTKIVMFSDNLKSINQIKEIHDTCRERVIDRYGIGTWLSNDVGARPLNIVIKLAACDFGRGFIKTVKLSDNPGKNTGNLDEINICKKVLRIE